MGGMGNQMFQYALGRNLAIKHNTKLKIDLSFLLDRTPRKDFVFRDYDLGIFNIQEDFADEKEIILYNRFHPTKTGKFLNIAKKYLMEFPYNLVEEPHYHFAPKILDAPDNSYLIGYWQSEKYFKNIEDIIRREFTLRKDLTGPARDMAKKIASENSVCVNVRRGDFVSIPKNSKFHGFCGMEYFDEGMRIIKEKIKNPHFFIFSDDIDWCRENFKHDSNITFLGPEYAGEKFGFYLILMSLCKHFIIPNSTFGWWGAWLGEYKEKIIIAPKNWFSDISINTKDVMPDGWMRI